MRILVTGSRGVLASAIHHVAADVTVVASSRPPVAPGWLELDLARPATIGPALDAAGCDAVLHPAAVTSPVWAERNPEPTRRINVDGSAELARCCRQRDLRLVALSTDLVFPGRDGGSYTELDPPRPLSVYGASKLDAEKAVLDAHRDALMVRTSLLLAPGRGHVTALRAALAGDAATLFDDEWRSPALAEDIARALLELCRLPVDGVLHLAGPERLSRLELGRRLAAVLGLDGSRIRSASRRHCPPPPRPGDISLDSSRALTWLHDTHPPRPIDSAPDILLGPPSETPSRPPI